MPVRLTETYLRQVIREELKEIFNMDKISPVVSRTYRALTSDDSNFQVKSQDYQDEIRNSNAWKFTVKPLLKKYGNEFLNYITQEFRNIEKNRRNTINILPKYKGGADKQIVFPEGVDNWHYALAFLEVITTTRI